MSDDENGEPSKLNEYHKMRNKAAMKEVQEMMKHPFSLEQAKAQSARIKDQMMRAGMPKKSMKVSDYKQLIRVLPFMEQAFDVKRSHWENLVSSDILDIIFVEYADQNQMTSSGSEKSHSKPNDATVTISRFELFNDQAIDLLLIKVLMWGYPTKGRGKNIENIFKNTNFTKLKEDLFKYGKKGTIAIDEIRELLKMKGLGFSTLSKFLYFMRLKIDSYRALILDQRVISALTSGKYSDTGIEEFQNLKYENAIDYYLKYLTFSHQLADQLQAEPDQVEMFFFEYGRNLKGMVPMN